MYIYNTHLCPSDLAYVKNSPPTTKENTRTQQIKVSLLYKRDKSFAAKNSKKTSYW